MSPAAKPQAPARRRSAPRKDTWWKSNTTLLVGLAIQTLAGVWWLSGLSATVGQDHTAIVELKGDYVPKAQIAQGQQDIQHSIDDVKSQLNILLTRTAPAVTPIR